MKLFGSRTASPFPTAPTPPDTAARVLRDVGLAIAPRIEHHLPGITAASHDDTVVCADAEERQLVIEQMNPDYEALREEVADAFDLVEEEGRVYAFHK